MDTMNYEGDLGELIKWLTQREDDLPKEYMSWLMSFLPEECKRNIGHWVGTITPDSPLDGDWVQGFPHVHTESVGWNKTAMTVMTCLSAPAEGGQFGMGGLDKDDPYEFIDVKPGLSFIMDGSEWHGAKPVLQGTRIMLISTGMQETFDPKLYQKLSRG